MFSTSGVVRDRRRVGRPGTGCAGGVREALVREREEAPDPAGAGKILSDASVNDVRAVPEIEPGCDHVVGRHKPVGQVELICDFAARTRRDCHRTTPCLGDSSFTSTVTVSPGRQFVPVRVTCAPGA